MTKFFSILLVFLMSLPAFAVSGRSGLPDHKSVRTMLNRGNVNGFATQLGVQMQDKKVQLLKGTYRYADQGGNSGVTAQAVLTKLRDVDGKDAVLPINAIIKQVTVDVLTTPTASAVTGFTAPFLSLGLNSETDLMPFTAVASLTGKVAGTPIGTAATMVKALGNSAVTLNIKGGSVTAGSFNVYIEYYLAD